MTEDEIEVQWEHTGSQEKAELEHNAEVLGLALDSRLRSLMVKLARCAAYFT